MQTMANINPNPLISMSDIFRLPWTDSRLMATFRPHAGNLIT